jgi:hypothetical protein
MQLSIFFGVCPLDMGCEPFWVVFDKLLVLNKKKPRPCHHKVVIFVHLDLFVVWYLFIFLFLLLLHFYLFFFFFLFFSPKEVSFLIV